VLLVVVGPSRPRPTALLSPSSDGKPEAVTTVVVAPDDGLLVVVGSSQPRPTALLSPSSDGKPEAATTVVVAPDDGHEDT